jgi:PAS domain S-box-containing protein
LCSWYAELRQDRGSAGRDDVLVRRDGSLVDVEVTVSSVGGGSGFSLVSREVSERRSTEETLRALVESAPDAFVVVGVDGRIVLVNARAEELFGYGRDDLVGRSVEDLVPEVARRGHVEHREQYTSSPWCRPMGAHVDLNARRKDGTEVPVDICLSPVKTRRGAWVCASIRDISSRKAAAESLRQQAQLLDLAHDAILVRDLEQRVTFWNRGAEKTYGWLAEEAIGKRVPELLRARYDPPLEEIEKTVLSAGQWDGELRHLRRDGTPLIVESRWALQRDGRDRPTAILQVNRDVTARRNAERALARRTEELARSNAELETFAYVASHDLQEPLRKVAAFCQLLQRRYEGQLDEKADAYLGLAVDGAKRMHHLIADLLVYCRAGRAMLPSQPIDSGEVAAQAVDNLQVACDEADAAILLGELPMVRANPTQLLQVFQNLLSNAIKFRGDRRPEIHLSAEQVGDEYRFVVRDNGIGIEEDHGGRLFVPFQRVHPRDAYPGTGIGLALCKKIVESHGGRIWFDSEVGSGSRFYFTLPVEGGEDAD